MIIAVHCFSLDLLRRDVVQQWQHIMSQKMLNHTWPYLQDQLGARAEEDAAAGVPLDADAAGAFEAAKAWVLPRVGSAFRLSARPLLPPELLTAVMVSLVWRKLPLENPRTVWSILVL